MEQLAIPPAGAVEKIRFESERQLYTELVKDADVQRRAQEIKRQDETEANRRRLLAAGLRITSRIIPSLVETVGWAQRVAQLQDRGVELYVLDDPRQYASCTDLGQGRLYLLLSSSLVEKMSERELIFVIGHELGHAAYGHHALPARAMLTRTPGAPGPQALRLMSWNRRAEISADRVGLLCCQDMHTAASAFIKLSCGLTESIVQFNVDDYVSQMQDIQTLSGSVQDSQDWFSTHPFNPLRVVALHHFWESALLAECLGRPAAGLTTSAMDDKINALLRFMEPEPAQAGQADQSACLMWAGYWVALSDGGVDAAESASIREIVDAAAAQQAERDIRNSLDPLAFARDKFQQAAQMCLKTPPAERHALVQKLVVVARANKQITDGEKAALQQVCQALEINPLFVEQILLMIG